MSSQCLSATRDLAVGGLDDLGGFPDCLIPDVGVGVGEGSFGDVEPSGDRGPPLDGDGGAPALVEVADGEDAVLIIRAVRAATGRARESAARHPAGTQQSSQPASSHVQQQNEPLHASRRV
jgi:hypothetical protein